MRVFQHLQEKLMGLADKVRNDELAGRRAVGIRRMVWAVIGLAFFLFVLFYFLLPWWRGTPQP